MWIDTVSMCEVRSRSRWKVEIFCGDAPAVSHAAFDLVALRQIVTERKETLDPQAYPDHVFNYLGLEHVQSMTGDLVDFAPRKGKEVRSRSKIFRRGDVLYGRLRPYLNKVYVADGRVSSGICSGEFFVLVPRTERVSPSFLRAVLASDYVQKYVGSLQTGSALPRLHVEDLLKIKIPLPPLTVQKSYEVFLSNQATLRRRLVAELATLPQATIAAIVSALESGQEPIMSTPPQFEVTEEDPNPLPELNRRLPQVHTNTLWQQDQ